MTYTEDARYFQFMVESAIETEKINGFVKSIVGVSESASPKKLWTVHEDVGDKIRALWDKFIAFLNRVWAKFVEFTQKIVNSDKGYLEQYKDIILNKKPEDVDLEMRDYAAGIHRMTSVSVPPFNTVKDTIPVDEADITFKSKLIPDYKDATKDFAGFAVAYFQGGEDKKSTNLTNLNMTDLYNFCHDFDKIKVTIEKDKNTLSKTFNDAQAIIQKSKSDAQNPPVKPEVKPNVTDTTTTPKPMLGPDGKPVNQQQITTPKPILGPDGKPIHASYSLDNYIGSYFSEVDAAGGGNMTIGTKSDPNAAANTTATTGGTKASSNMASVQTSTEPAVVPTATEDLDVLTKKIGSYNGAASAVVTAKMTSSHVIYKDYMKLIKLHVGAHVGKDGDTQVAQTGTDHRIALKLDDPAGILKTIAQIEDPKTDANTKSKLTSELNTKVIAANPNFPGGIDAIKAAATATTPKA